MKDLDYVANAKSVDGLTPEDLNVTPMSRACLAYIIEVYPDLMDFWFRGNTEAFDVVTKQDHADFVYSLFLLGLFDLINPKSARFFADWLRDAPLYGRTKKGGSSDEPLNAHATAYQLGTLRLLSSSGLCDVPHAICKNWNIKALIDDDGMPVWPRHWSHHVWRVSHWIGGAPSILAQVASFCECVTEPNLVDRVLSKATSLLDPVTGLLRPYRSELVQRSFRTLYRLRHNPNHGVIGGVVHLLWAFHASDRPYIAAEQLHKFAWRHLPQSGFLESTPYCLDFDFIQLLRTTSDHAECFEDLSQRVVKYRYDIEQFLSTSLDKSYKLHKLPGALATIHEATLIVNDHHRLGERDKPVDIIKEALWI